MDDKSAGRGTNRRPKALAAAIAALTFFAPLAIQSTGADVIQSALASNNKAVEPTSEIVTSDGTVVTTDGTVVPVEEAKKTPTTGKSSYKAPKNVVPVCGSASEGGAECGVKMRTDLQGVVPAPAGEEVSAHGTIGNAGGYDPAYLRSAYNLEAFGSTAGIGKTVAIVTAYDSPTVEADLATYRSHYGLPPCTTANGCFKKVNQNGAASPLPAFNSGWATETALDTDMVSAICPNCKILLVEAKDATFTNLGPAVNTAVSLGANAISNSYGAKEFPSETSWDSYYNHPGVLITASTGDSGYGVSYPAASQYVLAVGGTTLNQATNTGTRNATETAWKGAGSGCSAYEPKPSWQKDTGCAKRSNSDVSAVADPATGVWIYRGSWSVVGGTSASSPIVAALGMLVPSGFSTSDLYTNAASLIDITSGSNGTCGTYLCNGVSGYDGPTGLGVFNGPQSFAADFSLSATPATQTVTAGTGATVTANLTALRSYGKAVTVSIDGAPVDTTLSTSSPTWSESTASTTITVPKTAAKGTYNITITATDGDTRTHTARVTIVVRDYAMQASTSTFTMIQGQKATFTEKLTTDSGYATTVGLAATGMPTGMTVTLPTAPKAPTTSGATLTGTIATTATTPVGTYPITITATGTDVGKAAHANVITVKVIGYTASAGESAVTAAPGDVLTKTVTYRGSDNTVGPVLKLAVSGLPKGVTAKVGTLPTGVLTTSGTDVEITFTVAATAPAGSSTVKITSSAPLYLAQVATIDFTVKGFTTAAATATVATGSSATANVAINPTGAFASNVSVKVLSLPKGVTVAAPVSTMSVGSSATAAPVTFNAASTAAKGTYKVSVQFIATGYPTQTAVVTLTVN